MTLKRYLRRLNSADIPVVRDVYRDAVQALKINVYSQHQLTIWSSLPFLPGFLDRPLSEGSGWVSIIDNKVEAFGLRYPLNRLALLYCRGRSFRQGHATALIQRIELEAFNEGQTCLFTEASFCSYELFLKNGWRLRKPEDIIIGGVEFSRFLMDKDLRS